MSPVVYASGQIGPGPVAAPGGLTMSWTGWDGSVWDLADSSVSGVVMGPGVRGLGAPPSQRFSTSSPAVAGSRFRGSRVLEREVFWPLSVLADTGLGWVDRDSAFWRTLRVDAPGSWAVTSPGGTTRTLRCRLADVDEEFVVDPTRHGWASYGVHLVADDDPFWSGAPLVRSFSPGSPVDFFDPAGSPPFHISAGNLLATATLDNPGDVDAFPIWRVDGPTTSVTVGVDGRNIVIPITVAGGASLTVDTRPQAQTAIRSDGTDVTASLGAVDFAAVPPGAVVPLSLSMVGTGTVTATLQPRYFRAW